MNNEDIYVVGIGASAGGIQALQQLVASVEGKPNVAFVIVQHLKRDYQSNLNLILGRFSHLPVLKIKDKMQVEANKIFIAPENMKVSLIDNQFSLIERSPLEIINHTINHFFISLAEAKKNKSIGIILSGTGSDGTKGFHAIEKYNGVTIVQNPQTAQFDGMPNHSIRYDHPSYILSPEEIPEVITKIAKGEESMEERGRRRLSDYVL